MSATTSKADVDIRRDLTHKKTVAFAQSITGDGPAKNEENHVLAILALTEEFYSLCKVCSSMKAEQYRFFRNKVSRLASILEYHDSKLRDVRTKRKLKSLFRLVNNRFISKASLVKRGLRKPLGYPGDYQIIEAIYDRSVSSEGIGYFIDRSFQEDGYVKAVRRRKSFMRDYMYAFLNERRAKKISVLNIASGSCREIRELLSRKTFADKELSFHLVDQERKAIAFSRKNLRNYKHDFNFYAENIASFRDSRHFLNDAIQQQDLVYSIGLADYLPDSFLSLLIRFAYAKLHPKGEFILAHKNLPDFKSVLSEWICDWKFLPRSPSEVLSIYKRALAGRRFQSEVLWGADRFVFYIKLTKC